MKALNLPTYSLKIKSVNNREYVYDQFRKKYVRLTPEEWVRQNFVQFLVQEKNIPQSMIGIEKEHTLYKMKRRSDILIFGNQGLPAMVVECKAPTIKISQKSFDQVARYNMILKVKYLVVTNGLQHFCCLIDFGKATYSFLEEIPDYSILKMT